MGEQKGIQFPFLGGFNFGGKKIKQEGYNFCVHSLDKNISIQDSQQHCNSSLSSEQLSQYNFQIDYKSNGSKKLKNSRFARLLQMHDVVGRELELFRGSFLAVISGVGMELGSGVQKLNIFDNARVGMLRDAMLALQPTTFKTLPQSKRRQQKQARWQQQQAQAHYECAMQYAGELRLKRAISELEKAVELEPSNIQYLAQLSKQWTDYTYVPQTPPETIRQYNKKAMELAQKIIDLDPSDPLGYIAMCASQGRLALYSDNKAKAQLAKSSREMANIALEKDSENDYCYLIQGAWNYEMAGLNVVVRTIIRLLFGTNLDPGSYEDALQCFKQAEKLNPHRQLTQVQLGKVYRKLGMEEECIKCLQRSFDMGYEDVNEHLELITATSILREIQPNEQFKDYYDLIPPHQQQ
eukprot:TRINITY_DN17982_c0_g1_i5.p1 TRINITY_DN17982_c0_g1~~TRINITY_DN17982_c0_g1_i5.p1  ORF type:complete len:410 (-),score=46.96 TRINITY_DN17982_c0_g1_i5:508-1737(-)